MNKTKEEIIKKLTGHIPITIRSTKGIDVMMIDMIQFRAMIYAFKSLEGNHAFIQTVFFKTWQVGITYAIYSLFGKLADKQQDVSSLKKSWDEAYENPSFPKDSNTKSLNAWFKKLGRNTSQTIAYRHLVIAHNAEEGKYEPSYDWTNYNWNKFDTDFKQLVNAWGVLSKFSGTLLALPFASGKETFNELNFIFKPHDMQVLAKKYDKFIVELCKNCNFSQKIIAILK